MGYDLKYDNTNMPEKYVSPINNWLQARLTSLNGKS